VASPGWASEPSRAPTLAEPATTVGTTEFDSVAASSPTNAWIVGHTSSIPVHTLTLHWNGKTWRRVPSPGAPGKRTSSYLFAVATTSPDNAWAVGESNARNFSVLIEHWNGKSWKVVPGATIARGSNVLTGIATITASDVWTVGSVRVGPSHDAQTLIEHWNGTTWRRVPSPSVTGSKGEQVQIGLGTVAAIARNNIWADGSYIIGSHSAQTLIEHWNGTKWSIVPSPDPQGSSIATYLHGLAAVSSSDIFAVGSTVPLTDASQTAILRWNGNSWHTTKSPNPGTDGNGLGAVAAVSSSDVWAVGGSLSKTTGNDTTLILHWNGTKWLTQHVPVPRGADNDGLESITAVSGRAAWAVGASSNASGSVVRPLLLHWNGTQWAPVSLPSTLFTAAQRG
jgi:hypothetical protein